MKKTPHPMLRYVRPGADTTAMCPGCGNGIIAHSTLRAIDELGLDMDRFVFVSGIGCSGWIPSPYFHADTLHTTHGRPVAFATGVKLARPELNVMVFSGDGDLSAIGGNHFIHAARRNIGITVVCVNNGIYGMTGGQVAPTTPPDVRTVTTPYGNLERTFDLCALAEAAGAPYVARWTTYHARPLTRSVKKALGRRGFNFIEVITQCPVQFGRRAGTGNAVRMMEGYRKNTVTVQRARSMTEEERAGKWIVGEFVEREEPELGERIRALWRRV